MAQIERAIRKFTLFSAVQGRSMYTAMVNVSEGDTSRSLWEGYLSGIEASLQPWLSSGCVFTTVERQTRIGDSWYTQEEWPSSFAGAQTGDAVANLLAIVFIGVASSFHGHGRKFISGLAEATVSGNVIAAGAVADMATALAHYIGVYTSVHSGTLTPGVLDKAGGFHSFSSGFVSSLLGTMRRRKPGIGI